MNCAPIADFASLAQAALPCVIAGTTASGKSQLAVQLAQTYAGEIINLDPYQSFQALETLTAQPSPLEQKTVPHHLYGIHSLEVELSAAQFAKDVKETLSKVQARGKWPILVTGSGLYLRAFSHGLSPTLPPTPPDLAAQLAKQSLSEKLTQLELLDPIEAGRIDQKNPRRVERALALCLLLGEPVSQHRKANLSWDKQPQIALKGILLSWERDALWQRIEARTQNMFSNEQFAQEINAIEGKPLGPTAAKVIGLCEARAWLAGKLSTTDAVEKISILTRQYAKRQRTWFAKEQWLTTACAQSILKATQ